MKIFIIIAVVVYVLISLLHFIVNLLFYVRLKKEHKGMVNYLTGANDYLRLRLEDMLVYFEKQKEDKNNE